MPSELPQLTAAMCAAGLTARATRQIVAACDAGLAAQFRADAEHLPAGALVMLWSQAPNLAITLRAAEDAAMELSPVSP